MDDVRRLRYPSRPSHLLLLVVGKIHPIDVRLQYNSGTHYLAWKSHPLVTCDRHFVYVIRAVLRTERRSSATEIGRAFYVRIPLGGANER